jgi:hypothetical protein
VELNRYGAHSRSGQKLDECGEHGSVQQYDVEVDAQCDARSGIQDSAELNLHSAHSRSGQELVECSERGSGSSQGSAVLDEYGARSGSGQDSVGRPARAGSKDKLRQVTECDSEPECLYPNSDLQNIKKKLKWVQTIPDNKSQKDNSRIIKSIHINADTEIIKRKYDENIVMSKQIKEKNKREQNSQYTQYSKSNNIIREKERNLYTKNYNKKTQEINFEIGQLVVKCDFQIKKKVKNTLIKRWPEIYKVIRRLSPVTYEIQHLKTNKKAKVDANQIKPYYEREENKCTSDTINNSNNSNRSSSSPQQKYDSYDSSSSEPSSYKVTPVQRTVSISYHSDSDISSPSYCSIEDDSPDFLELIKTCGKSTPLPLSNDSDSYHSPEGSPNKSEESSDAQQISYSELYNTIVSSREVSTDGGQAEASQASLKISSSDEPASDPSSNASTIFASSETETASETGSTQETPRTDDHNYSQKIIFLPPEAPSHGYLLRSVGNTDESLSHVLPKKL